MMRQIEMLTIYYAFPVIFFICLTFIYIIVLLQKQMVCFNYLFKQEVFGFLIKGRSNMYFKIQILSFREVFI